MVSSWFWIFSSSHVKYIYIYIYSIYLEIEAFGCQESLHLLSKELPYLFCDVFTAKKPNVLVTGCHSPIFAEQLSWRSWRISGIGNASFLRDFSRGIVEQTGMQVKKYVLIAPWCVYLQTTHYIYTTLYIYKCRERERERERERQSYIYPVARVTHDFNHPTETSRIEKWKATCSDMFHGQFLPKTLYQYYINTTE